MSVPTTIQSKQVPMALSVDGVTYKNVVCKRTTNFNGTTAVNAEESDCGIEKGLGAPDWTMDFEGIVNTTPDSPTEISAAEIMGYWLNQTELYAKLQPGNLYIQGRVFLTDVGVQLSTGNLIAFTFTLNGIGVPDITA